MKKLLEFLFGVELSNWKIYENGKGECRVRKSGLGYNKWLVCGQYLADAYYKPGSCYACLKGKNYAKIYGSLQEAQQAIELFEKTMLLESKDIKLSKFKLKSKS